MKDWWYISYFELFLVDFFAAFFATDFLTAGFFGGAGFLGALDFDVFCSFLGEGVFLTVSGVLVFAFFGFCIAYYAVFDRTLGLSSKVKAQMAALNKLVRLYGPSGVKFVLMASLLTAEY